jgi:hypothetical protein
MEINPGRDLILSLAGKRLRGEAFTQREENFLEVFASLPGFNNPIQLACPKCRGNLVVMMRETDTPPARTFERTTSGEWRCVCCGTPRVRAGVVHVH